MKTTWMIGIMAILMIPIVLADALDNDLEAVLLNQDPDPVEPNRYVDVRWRVNNQGLSEARNIEVELVPQYPFTIERGDDSIKSIGTLLARQIDEYGVIVKFRLRVDANAVHGTNQVKLRYRIDGSSWTDFDEYELSVRSRDPILSIEDVKMIPQSVEPGRMATISFKLNNMADVMLRNLKITLDIKRRLTTATSVTYEEMPITPLDSTNEKILRDLLPGKESEITFQFLADPDADPGVYKLPITLTYSDDFGRNYTRNYYTSLIIKGVPQIVVHLDDSDELAPGKRGTAVVKFINKGLHEVKFLDIKVEDGEDYALLSAGEVYIGNIDSDDYETLELDLYVKQGAEKITVPLSLTFNDGNNQQYEMSKDIEISLYSDEEMKDLGLQEKSNGAGLIIVIVVVVIGIVIYLLIRRRKKS
ncbi:MAG: COG1361 S-layer family protein [Nanoarchaeota archaeon]|nr:COG1361 S-layer family protein [Nanoarchaeota archaeon]